MNRRLVPDLASPVPLGTLMPPIYERLDPSMMLFCDALDEVVAPAWLSLDCFDCYLDPELAPSDFVTMLAAWVGLTLDDNWREDQARRLVGNAVDLFRWRGTVRGLAALVEAYTGVIPEITESGGVSWSAEPGGAAPPGTAVPAVHVRVVLPADSTEHLPRLTRLVVEAVPAHVAASVEVVRGEGSDPERIDAAEDDWWNVGLADGQT